MDEPTGKRRLPAGLEAYVRHYGANPEPQDAAEATTDNQLKSLVGILQTSLHGRSDCTVVDVGCGNGILLQRLCEGGVVSTTGSVKYVGVDYENFRERIFRVAFDHGVTSSCAFEALTVLQTGLDASRVPVGSVLVLRNVLHELDPHQTAELMSALGTLRDRMHSLVVQDLVNLTIGERGGVCWSVDSIQQLARALGYDCSVQRETSKSGALWFNAICTPSLQNKPTQDVLQSVLDARLSQLNAWEAAGELADGDRGRRGPELANLDFDLQRGFLRAQVAQAAADVTPQLSPAEAADLANGLLLAEIASYSAMRIPPAQLAVSRQPVFRDRESQQNDLEVFLRSGTALALVLGPPRMGKSTLVAEVLARRSYRRSPVVLTAAWSSNVWSLLEQYFDALGLHLPTESLRDLQVAGMSSVGSSLNALFAVAAQDTIAVVEHFERLLDDTGLLKDQEVATLLAAMTGASNAKVFLCSSVDPESRLMAPLPESVVVRVGRLPERNVENVLDDFVDRSALRIEEYPQDLLEAIDRHPFLAVLAGRVIASEGAPALHDTAFLRQLRKRLRDELLTRIMPVSAREAVQILSLVRRPLPVRLVEGVTTRESVAAALRSGVAYQIGPDDEPLIQLLGALRPWPDGDQPDEDARTLRTLHAKLADWLRGLYESSGRPIWLRESYYHSLLGGQRGLATRLGTAYRDGFVDLGEQLHRYPFRDYEGALEAFRTAHKFGDDSVHVRMRIAMCLLRGGDYGDGVEAYEELAAEYPNLTRIKSSFVDSLLAVGSHEEALRRLLQYGLVSDTGAWTAGQWGRAQAGRFHYTEAVAYFQTAITLRPDEQYFVWLERAYQNLGDADGVRDTLDKGLSEHPDSLRLLLLEAEHLIRLNTEESLGQAEKVLVRLSGIGYRPTRVAYNLVKLLCLSDRIADAKEALASIDSDHPDAQKHALLARIELTIAFRNWNEALSQVAKLDPGAVRTGLERKVSWLWAASLPAGSPVLEQVAQRAFARPLEEAELRNIQILAPSLRLALACGLTDLTSKYGRALADINPSLAHEITTEDVRASSYVERASFGE